MMGAWGDDGRDDFPEPDIEDMKLSEGAKEVASQLSEAQQLVLLSGDGDEVPAGIGTWRGLQAKGLLDDKLNTTPFGIEVAYALIQRNL